MFNYGFNNYTNKVLIDNKEPLDLVVEVCSGKKKTLEVIAENPFYVFSHKNEKRSVEVDFIPINKIIAPISIGEKIGELKIYENHVEIGSVNVLANEDVYKKTYIDNIINIGENWALT